MGTIAYLNNRGVRVACRIDGLKSVLHDLDKMLESLTETITQSDFNLIV